MRPLSLCVRKKNYNFYLFILFYHILLTTIMIICTFEPKYIYILRKKLKTCILSAKGLQRLLLAVLPRISYSYISGLWKIGQQLMSMSRGPNTGWFQRASLSEKWGNRGDSLHPEHSARCLWEGVGSWPAEWGRARGQDPRCRLDRCWPRGVPRERSIAHASACCLLERPFGPAFTTFVIIRNGIIAVLGNHKLRQTIRSASRL